MVKNGKRSNPTKSPKPSKFLKVSTEEGKTFIQGITSQLLSEESDTREIGLNSLSIGCENHYEEINENLIKTVGNLLTDVNSSFNVKLSAAGALRNLSCISAEFCEFMVRNDVLSSVVTFIQSNGSVISDDDVKILTEVVNTLWNLCESSGDALKIFNRERLSLNLTKYLGSSHTKLAIAAAQCLYSATEDNRESVVSVPELNRILDIQLDNNLELIYLKTLAVGILLNGGKELDGALIKILTSALDFNHLDLLKKFSSDVPVHKEEELTPSLDAKVDEICSILQCQTLALEIFCNCFSADDIEGLDDCEDDISEEFDEAMDTDDADPIKTDNDAELTTPLKGIPLKVFEKTKGLPVNVVEILLGNKNGQKLIATLTRERTTALLCLQNLIEAADSKFDNLDVFWPGIVSYLSEHTDVEMLEAVSSALRAIVQFWSKTNKPDISLSVITSTLPKLYEVYENQKNVIPKVNVNLIKTIGGIGLLIMKEKQEPQLINEIGKFLFSCLKLEEPGKVWIVAETLDTIFDVFAEDDYNQVLKEVSALKILTNLMPTFKKMIRQEKVLPEYRPVIQTASCNLPRFIQYKKPLIH